MCAAGEVEAASISVNVTEGSDAIFCVLLTGTGPTDVLENAVTVDVTTVLSGKAGLLLILQYFSGSILCFSLKAYFMYKTPGFKSEQ